MIKITNVTSFIFSYDAQDGNINYDEFVAMMRKGSPEPNMKKRRDVVI